MTLGLSVLHMRAQLRAPFLVPRRVLDRSRDFYAKLEAQNKELERMKDKDTDRDGLNDYSEQFVYQTSPYLTDSDSDGIPDSVEIAQGTNPNCPSGRSCVSPIDAFASASATEANSDLLAVPKTPQAPLDALLGAGEPGVVGAQQFLANPPDPGTMTAALVREYLINANLVQPEQVRALPDDVVMQIYRSAYAEAKQVQAASQSASVTTTSAATSTR